MSRNIHEEARGLVTSDEEQLQTIKLYAERRTGFILSELDRRGLLPVYEEIAGMERSDLNWASVGVTDEDVAFAAGRGIAREWLHRVFCHPVLVATDAKVLAYYRNLAGISGKAQGHTLPRLRRIETGQLTYIESDEVLGEIAALNEVLRRALLDPLFTERVIDPLLFVSEGASIDGAWRNVIGRIAVWEVMRFLIAILQDSGEFVRLRIGRRIEGVAEQEDRFEFHSDATEDLQREGGFRLSWRERMSRLSCRRTPTSRSSAARVATASGRRSLPAR